MPNLGGWEWVIILVIVLLIFGIGRISKLGEELGRGIRAFREGVKEGKGEKEPEEKQEEEKAG
ncbi:MAG: twin-arginine translocase TatA/TatE family subunit [Chloroflexi bacterium]|nr:twin-arginine translocase TatA/TatE family subunit [Chloroflexota bacterium]MCI0577164.1 twin-arginine translocase TatA/TatE family subunit [Chloroflexota bacterium]MCI0649903.1 twin-arginine translocase TatA/TatE family subunit [Chloroflexota bacterium]MCI0725673.1 twin-arginine translocase TatA/TatE family subunit [Chloroflexota bacterium]